MSPSKQLTILQMNDSHGYLDLHEEMFWAGDHAEYRKAGGYGRIAALLNHVREERPGQVLAFDCGETIHGTYAAVQTQGQAMVPILNAMGFQAMTAHWEFAYGPARFREITSQLDYPMLAINCYDKKTDELIFEPYLVTDVGGLRVGVIGIAATIVDKVMPASFSKGIYFTLGNEELPAYVDVLRSEEQVDLVVLISHLGFPQEMKLAGEVDGIDVLLSGHTHNRIYRPARVGDAQVVGQTATPLHRYRVLEATMDTCFFSVCSISPAFSLPSPMVGAVEHDGGEPGAHHRGVAALPCQEFPRQHCAARHDRCHLGEDHTVER